MSIFTSLIASEIFFPCPRKSKGRDQKISLPPVIFPERFDRPSYYLFWVFFQSSFLEQSFLFNLPDLASA